MNNDRRQSLIGQIVYLINGKNLSIKESLDILNDAKDFLLNNFTFAGKDAEDK